jgi:hypothetical protein
MREVYRLRVFEGRVLRRIFVPKWDKVTGGWRKLDKEELRDLYSSPSIIRTIKSKRTRRAGHVARLGEGEEEEEENNYKKNTYRLLVRKPEGRKPLRRPRNKRVDNIQIDRRNIGLGVVEWIDLAHGRAKWKAVENAVLNLLVS